MLFIRTWIIGFIIYNQLLEIVIVVLLRYQTHFQDLISLILIYKNNNKKWTRNSYYLLTFEREMDK